MNIRARIFNNNIAPFEMEGHLNSEKYLNPLVRKNLQEKEKEISFE